VVFGSRCRGSAARKPRAATRPASVITRILLVQYVLQEDEHAREMAVERSLRERSTAEAAALQVDAQAKTRATPPVFTPRARAPGIQCTRRTCFPWVKTAVLTSMDTAAQSAMMCRRVSSTCPRTSCWRSCTGWMASLSHASGGQQSQYTQPHHISRRSSSHRAGG
jgi:hypothetical protein